MPTRTITKPAPNVTFPHQSIRAAVLRPVSRSFAYAQTVPNSPKGTLIQNTSRQCTSARTPPTTNPVNEPTNPAIRLMPMAIPRCSTGKASVRIAVAFAHSSAPPMPCAMRNTISSVAPAAPVLHVSESAIEPRVKIRNPRLYIRTRPKMSPIRPNVTTSTAVTTR
jgi:hypothetical protein